MSVLEDVAGGDDQCGLLGMGTHRELVKRAGTDVGDERGRSHSVRKACCHAERRTRVDGFIEGAQDKTMLPSIRLCRRCPARKHQYGTDGPHRQLPLQGAQRCGDESCAYH
jgi:hypothetical protein